MEQPQTAYPNPHPTNSASLEGQEKTKEKTKRPLDDFSGFFLN